MYQLPINQGPGGGHARRPPGGRQNAVILCAKGDPFHRLQTNRTPRALRAETDASALKREGVAGRPKVTPQG